MLRYFRILLVRAVVAAAWMAASAADKPEVAAQKTAESWLALVDAGKYGESWEQAASSFKSAVTREAWEGQIKNVMDQVGKLKSRKFKVSQYAKDPPNTPPGEYVMIQYESAFENAPSTTETIIPSLEKGEWRVSGYFVKPNQ